MGHDTASTPLDVLFVEYELTFQSIDLANN